MPLTAKGEKIKAAMEEEYGKEKGESILYASKNAGTITGIDAMSDPRPEDCADADPAPISELPAGMVARELSSRGDEGADQMATSGTSTASTGVTAAPPVSPVMDQEEGVVMDPVPMPGTEHPQLHPDASAPPEPALGAADDSTGVYGGIAGGLTDWKNWGTSSFCDNVDAPPPPTVNPAESPGVPSISTDELLQQNARYWRQMQ